MEIILLMNSIKCWCYCPLQVLRAAPALHSLIVRQRKDVADILEFLNPNQGCLRKLIRQFLNPIQGCLRNLILEFLNPIQGGLRKLILEYCSLDDDSTGIFANIVALYPDLEVLSLEGCRQLTPAGYRLIPRLKKLSELNPFFCEVDYVCVCVCVCEAVRDPRLHMWTHVAEHP